jgi:hypothetical protein
MRPFSPSSHSGAKFSRRIFVAAESPDESSAKLLQELGLPLPSDEPLHLHWITQFTCHSDPSTRAFFSKKNGDYYKKETRTTSTFLATGSVASAATSSTSRKSVRHPFGDAWLEGCCHMKQT